MLDSFGKNQNIKIYRQFQHPKIKELSYTPYALPVPCMTSWNPKDYMTSQELTNILYTLPAPSLSLNIFSIPLGFLLSIRGAGRMACWKYTSVVQKDQKTIWSYRATSELSKKSKIIEIRLRSSENGSAKRYHSHGGGSLQIPRFSYWKSSSNLRCQLTCTCVSKKQHLLKFISK